MDQGDQAVRFTTAIGGVQAEDRCNPLTTTQPATDVQKQVFQSTGWIGVGKEARRVRILSWSIAPENLCQVSGKLRVRHCALENVVLGLADGKDRR